MAYATVADLVARYTEPTIAGWFEDALRDGDWPRPAVSDEQQAQVYADVSAYQGRTDPEHPDFKGANLELRIPPKKPNQPADMAATVKTEVKHD